MTIPGTGSLTEIYLNDHLAGSTGGGDLADRVARSHRGRPDGPALARVAQEIGEDRSALLEIMAALEVPVRHYKLAAVWVAEKVGRAKLNGHLLSRSPLSDLVELEALQVGVHGKAAGWRCLRAIADTDSRLDADRLDELIERAEAQVSILEEIRLRIARRVLGRS